MSLLIGSVTGNAILTSTADPANSLAHSLFFPDHNRAALWVLMLTALALLVRWAVRRAVPPQLP